jgi:shikimate dehydrogenase
MKKFGLIGYPLAHSFSRSYFTAKFKDEGLDCAYENYPLESLGSIPGLIRSEPLLEGLNVTIPYKIEIIKYLDEIHDLAKKIGAVNVVKIDRQDSEPKLKGYNTDIYGFIESIKPLLRKDVKKAMILGTGGSSLAVAAGLEDLGIEYIQVSRNKNRGDITYNELGSQFIAEYPLVINATPVGTHPDDARSPNFPYKHLTHVNILFDLVYNPDQTLFMKKGISMGCRVSNGLEMLYKQALKSWEIWNECE